MDSHHRHRALQARALLTELPVQKIVSVVGLEPTPIAMFTRACTHATLQNTLPIVLTQTLKWRKR